MRRTLQHNDGTTSEFHLKEFRNHGPIRAEISVDSLAELKTLKNEGKLISVRMEAPPKQGRKRPQVNLVPFRKIEDIDWNA